MDPPVRIYILDKPVTPEKIPVVAGLDAIRIEQKLRGRDAPASELIVDGVRTSSLTNPSG
ncbi:MAG: hypothetical protein ABFS37_03270 [Acidobacteriota bacterium]